MNFKFQIFPDDGFTFLETMMVIFIMIILGSLLLANVRGPSRGFEIKRAAQTLAAEFRRAQVLALSAQTVTCGSDRIIPYYGLRIQADSSQLARYSIFADCNRNGVYDPASSDDFIVTSGILESVFSSSVSPSSGGWLEVVYIPPNPDVSVNGSTGDITFQVELCHVLESSACITTQGNSRGNVEIL